MMEGFLAEWVSAIAGAIATLLSAIAVIVAIWVAKQTNKQTASLATEQAQRELRVYFAERKAEFRDQCHSVLAVAETLETSLSPRVAELISAPTGGLDSVTTRGQLAELSSAVKMLTTFVDPVSGVPDGVMPIMARLLEEAAWVYSDSLHLAILSNESDSGIYVDIRDAQDTVDALLNGSAVNLDPCLLAGYDPNFPTGNNVEAHDAWNAAYSRRESLLLKSDIVSGAPLPSSLAEVAARSLGWISIRRFSDLTNEVLSKWEIGGEVNAKSNL